MFAPCAALITYHLHHSLLLTHSNHSVTLIKMCTLYFLVPFAGISLIRFYGSHFRGLSLLGYQWSTPTSNLFLFALYNHLCRL